jgi:hypothetical protein
MNPRARLLTLALMMSMALLLAIGPGVSASAFSGTATPTASPEPDLAAVCRETVDGLRALLPDDMPRELSQENAPRTASDFDIQTYFTVLDHLSLPDGLVLDWVYYWDGMGGFPVIYARPADQEPYLTYADFGKEYGEEWEFYPNYLDQIVVDGTPAGYLQLALLDVLGGQFYLFWHAGYMLRDVVCDPDGVEAIVTDKLTGDFGLPMTEEQAAAARDLDPAPVVTFADNTVSVDLIVFSDWRGFYRLPYAMQRDFPHGATYGEFSVLVPYDCGIMF